MTLTKTVGRMAAMFGLVLLSAVPNAYPQVVYSSIVGAVSLTVPASSDLYLTPSFSNSAVFRGEITSASTESVGFSGVDFGLGAYASGYFLLVEEGTLAGRMFEITANTATTLTLVDDDSELAAAATFVASVIPALTLGEMFPGGLGGKVEINPGNPDLILFSNDNTAGVEGFAPEAFYYYGDIGGTPGWRKVGSPLDQSHDDDALTLGEGFVVRNNSGADISFFLFGEVLTSSVRVPIYSKASGSTDNLVGAPRPLSIALSELGLSDGGVVEQTTDANEVKDTVRVFLNAGSGTNKAPDAEYCYYTDGWRKVVAGAVVLGEGPFDADLVPASAAIVVRKRATVEDQTVFWTNNWDLPEQS